jgi:hypothetical protein
MADWLKHCYIFLLSAPESSHVHQASRATSEIKVDRCQVSRAVGLGIKALGLPSKALVTEALVHSAGPAGLNVIPAKHSKAEGGGRGSSE